jgi:hypothetical protein
MPYLVFAITGWCRFAVSSQHFGPVRLITRIGQVFNACTLWVAELQRALAVFGEFHIRKLGAEFSADSLACPCALSAAGSSVGMGKFRFLGKQRIPDLIDRWVWRDGMA